MVVRNQTTEIYQGNTRILQFSVKDEDGTSAKNLTGYTATFCVARTNDEGVPLKKSPVIDHSTTDASPQLIITDEPNGVVEFTFAAADTSNLAAGEYYFELEVSDSASATLVVATGTLTVYTNVNNA
jgi:hypothetical protein